MSLVRVWTLKAGDRLKKGDTVVTVASIEWADSFIHYEKTTRAVKLSFVDDEPAIVSPRYMAFKV